MRSCATCSGSSPTRPTCKAIVIHGAGGNFCSGGDVHEIIGPLIDLPMPELLTFTRMTGDLVKAMRHCPQPVIAAVDGVCAGAGAIMAMASDLRFGTARSKIAFLFTRVGLAGCDMGACAHPAAHHRPGTRRRTALHRPLGERRRGARVGLLQSPVRAGRRSSRSAGARRGTGRRPDLRARDDEEDAASGMEHGRRRGDRSRGAGAGDLHGDAAISDAPIVRSPRRRGLCSRETDMSRRIRPHALDWPFFEDTPSRTGPAHRRVGGRTSRSTSDHDDVDADMPPARARTRRGGLAAYGVGGTAYGGHGDTIDTRAVCLLRETLARTAASPISRSRCRGWAPARSRSPAATRRRSAICRASPPARRSRRSRCRSPTPARTSRRLRSARAPTATRYVLDGEKTWISNGGIADFYVVFARTGEAPGARGISAFIVDADTPGLEIAERIDVIAPHPLARLRFDGCRVPRAALLGNARRRLQARDATLDIFRTSVAAASLGFARRAMDEGLARAASRKMFGQTLGDFQLTQAKLAQMALDHRQRRAARLSRRMAARSGQAASRAKRRWRSGTRAKARSR